MPFNILITFIVGSLFGWIVIQLTKPPPHLRGLILGCCSAGNLGNILLIIIPAVCKEKGSPFGDSDRCTTYGMAYVSLSMAVCSLPLPINSIFISQICSYMFMLFSDWSHFFMVICVQYCSSFFNEPHHGSQI